MSREHVALALMGVDQHENGAIAVSRVLREAQMKVEYYGKFNTPGLVADKAIQDGVDVIGISCHSWEYMSLVPQLVDELKKRGSNIPVVVGGSVITSEDGEMLLDRGVSAIFTSSTDTQEVIERLRELIRSTRHAGAE